MRVLILSAFLACVAAAPGLHLPIVPFIPPPTFFKSPIAAVIPVAIPTVSPGDVQAATIDAQVKSEDQARALADQARELAEQAVENQNEGVIEANDLAKEKSEQAFWNAEEQKWQALETAHIAEAQADAAVARSAYVPYIDPTVGAESPAGDQVMPGIVAKAAETVAVAPEAAAAAPAAVSPEAPTNEEQVAAVKTAEPEKPVEAATEKLTDSVQVESADLKAAAPESATMDTQKPQLIQPIAPAVLASVLSSARAYNHPFVAPVVYIQPGLKAVASHIIPPVPGHFVAPTILQTQW